MKILPVKVDLPKQRQKKPLLKPYVVHVQIGRNAKGRWPLSDDGRFIASARATKAATGPGDFGFSFAAGLALVLRAPSIRLGCPGVGRDAPDCRCGSRCFDGVLRSGLLPPSIISGSPVSPHRISSEWALRSMALLPAECSCAPRAWRAVSVLPSFSCMQCNETHSVDLETHLHAMQSDALRGAREALACNATRRTHSDALRGAREVPRA